MDVQKLEYNADIRIKFASINEKGGLDSDAYEEYTSFITELEQDWVAAEVAPIDTRFEWTRTAWVLSHGPTQIQIAAVEHETGIEILAMGTAIIQTSAAIVSFVKWGWNKWKSLRSSQPNKLEPSLVIERVADRLPDGRIRSVERIEIRGPLDAELVGRYVEQSFTELTGGI